MRQESKEDPPDKNKNSSYNDKQSMEEVQEIHKEEQ